MICTFYETWISNLNYTYFEDSGRETNEVSYLRASWMPGLSQAHILGFLFLQ